MSVYTGNQNEVSIGQVIVTDRDIYRKISNAESYDLYMLSHINDKFVWSRKYDSRDLKGAEIINMDRFSYTLENTILKDNEKFNFLTIYKVDENNTLTHTTTFSGSYDLPFHWNEISPPVNIRLINNYVTSNSLLDLPTHIDLTRECPEPECPEPEAPSDAPAQALDTWPDMINNDGWLSWDAPESAPEPAPDPVAPSEYEKARALNGWSNLINDDNWLSWNGPGPSISAAENLRRALHREPEPEPVETEPVETEPVAPTVKDEDDADDEDDDEDEDDMIYLEDVFEEERIDPYTGKWYTESEFIDYYRGDTEWIHQEPNKVLLREEYLKFTNTFSHLGAKKFIFLFNKYERTFR